jgi:hypothetical protein
MDKERAIVVTPTATTIQPSNDYSAYKGRGRYAKDVSAYVPTPSLMFLSHVGRRRTDQTINALYAINPERNGGLNFQFDEVVRNRDARKRLDGGDCECCREVRRLLLQKTQLSDLVSTMKPLGLFQNAYGSRCGVLLLLLLKGVSSIPPQLVPVHPSQRPWMQSSARVVNM